ncbi:MAG: metallophosphoesterase [Bacillota bacterium]|nr:metallophosphoesterase [Bacillota bacterium]
MSIYTIADLHLQQAPGVDKPMDVFGDRWYNHEERIRENWSRLIGDDDTVIVPGDISWGLKLEEADYDLRWIDSLPGRKILLKGNHDLWWTGIKKLNAMYDSITFLQYDSRTVDGISICGTRGWITPDDDDFTQADEKIYRRELLRLEASLKSADTDHIIGFMHYPPVAKPESFSGFQQLFEDYGVKEVYYGHIHGEEGFRKTIKGDYHGIRYHLVSADYLNCKPLLIR